MKRFLPLVILLILIGLAYYFRIDQYVTFKMLKEHRTALLGFVETHYILAPLIFIFVYFAVTSLALPIDIYFSLLSGFLFIQPLCTLYVIIGATLGAVTIFMIARTALGESFFAKDNTLIQKMKSGFQENEISYMFFLRLMPVFPFWLVNIAPAFFGVPLTTFAWTTLFGIIPGSFVFTQIGAGLGSILDHSEEFSLYAAFTTEMRIALIALALFALLPIFLKKIWKKNT